MDQQAMAFTIGLDIGGTKMNGIVYDGKNVVRELTVLTPKNVTSFKSSVLRLLELLSAGKVIAGVGVGVAGVVSPQSGEILYSPNMKFLVGFNMQKFLKSSKYKLVKVENDANCFALAESLLGKGKQMQSFVGITLGTGLGGGVVLNNKIHSGSRGGAGEAGHIMADFRYDTEHYFQKARDKKNYKKMGEVLGLLFANIVNLLDVDGIVIGGSIGLRFNKNFMPSALRTMKKHLVNSSFTPNIFVSTLKNSGSIGAALLVDTD